MKTRIRMLQLAFYLPVAVAFLRLGLTLAILIANPQNMPLRGFQIVPMIVVAITMFFYLKLYTDSVPIITLIVPSLVHFLIVLVFTGELAIVPFIAPLFTDILFLTVKGLKSSLYPFEIEGKEQAGDSFVEFDDLDY